jgi:two-component system KDP operon response regulator KdpE
VSHCAIVQQNGELTVFRSSDLTVDLVRRVVTVHGASVKLSPHEYDLLRLLVKHAGKVLPHQFVLKGLWGGDGDVQYIRIYIRQLRQKIEPDPKRPVHIVTEPGLGYRMQVLDYPLKNGLACGIVVR